MYAMRDKELAERIDGIITLSTPFLVPRKRDLSLLARTGEHWTRHIRFLRNSFVSLSLGAFGLAPSFSDEFLAESESRCCRLFGPGLKSLLGRDA